MSVLKKWYLHFGWPMQFIKCIKNSWFWRHVSCDRENMVQQWQKTKPASQTFQCNLFFSCAARFPEKVCGEGLRSCFCFQPISVRHSKTSSQTFFANLRMWNFDRRYHSVNLNLGWLDQVRTVSVLLIGHIINSNRTICPSWGTRCLLSLVDLCAAVVSLRELSTMRAKKGNRYNK